MGPTCQPLVIKSIIIIIFRSEYQWGLHVIDWINIKTIFIYKIDRWGLGVSLTGVN